MSETVTRPAQTDIQPSASEKTQTPVMENTQTPVMSGQMAEQMLQTMQMMQQQMLQMQQAQEERRISVKKAAAPSLKSEGYVEDPDANLDLLMNVPLEPSVEIGWTKKQVKEILELNKGSLVVLDRIAGEPVDLYVNGECIAKGDVVVVDDNFGIRITEILQEEIIAEE